MGIRHALALTTGFLLVAGNHGFAGRARAADTAPPPAPTVAELMARDLEGISDKEAVMMTVPTHQAAPRYRIGMMRRCSCTFLRAR